MGEDQEVKDTQDQDKYEDLVDGAIQKAGDTTSINAYQLAAAIVLAKFMESQQWAQSALATLMDLSQQLVGAASELQPKEFDIKFEGIEGEPGSEEGGGGEGEEGGKEGEEGVKKKTEESEFLNFNPAQPEAPDLSGALSGIPTPPTAGDFKNIELPSMSGLQSLMEENEPPATNDLASAVDDLQEYLAAANTIMDFQDVLHSNLTDRLEGRRLAIDEYVESQIWEREKERSEKALREAKDNIASEWSKRGFSLPNGVLVARMQEAELAYQDKRLDLSREVAIKQAELTNANSMRALELTERYQEFCRNLVFQTKKFGWEAKLAFKQAQLAVYEAYLKKYQMLMELYKAISSNKLDEARTKAQIFASEVQAYSAIVKAVCDKIDAMARVYGVAVEQYKAQADVFATRANVYIKRLDVKLQEMIAKTNLYLKNIEIEIKNYEVISSLKIEAIRAAAQAAAQLLAGIMSAVSVGATVGARGETSTSTSHQHTYKEK